jgi:sensor histidine kinase YesM
VKPARLLPMRVVAGYAAVFWAFYELLIFYYLCFRPLMDQRLHGVRSVAVYCGIIVAFDYLTTLGIFLFVDALARHRRSRAVELGGLALVLVAASLAMIVFDAWLETQLISRSTFPGAVMAHVVSEFHDTLLTNAFLAGLASALRSWAAEAQARVEESQLEAARARAEMAALTANVQPALVVRDLRRIRAAVVHDAEGARTLIRQLAETLRDSFRKSDPAPFR